MDVCPSALLELLRSDLFRSIPADDHHYLEPEVKFSFTRLADPRLVAARALVLSFLKKFGEDQRESKAADRAAFELFNAWNTKCEEWQEPVAANEVEAIALGEFQSSFLQCFELPNGELIDFPGTVPMYFRTGPGAAVGADLTDLYSKMSGGPLSTTRKDLYYSYVESTLPFEVEFEAEVKRSSNFETPVVRGSTLGFAPKNREISRTRCTEPSLNMIYQLATGLVLEDKLREIFNIDLSTQPQLNQELSRLGSISGRFGTTDQSSASDATSCKFWDWAMKYPEIRNWFYWIRSPMTKHPFKKGEWVELHMLSSMGNGFTFPLMTLIYLCVVKAAYRTLGIPLVYNKTVVDRTKHPSHPEYRKTKPGNFGVFGDDIIVVTEAFALVNRLLELLGYKVNSEKSFGAGPFRESCGTDWFLGQNVRGVYCKRLKQPQFRYSLINRLNAWSAEWDLPLPNIVSALLKTVWYLPVPPWEAADSGVIVPFSVFNVKKLDEHRGFVYHGMRPTLIQWEPERGLTPKHTPPQGTRWESGFDEDGCLNWHLVGTESDAPEAPFVNEWGVILAYVRGYIRDKRINCRDDNVRYHKTRLTTPGWAFTGESTCGFSRLGWARFEKIIASLNLGKQYA